MLERRLHAGLRSVFRIRCDFLATMLLFLLHFLVVRDISRISHKKQIALRLRRVTSDLTPSTGAMCAGRSGGPSPGSRGSGRTRVKPEGRKGEGVEPSRQRVAPPTGFEARPPHQGRFPSMCIHGNCLPPAPNSMVSGRSKCTSFTRRVYPTRSKNSSN